MAQDGQQHGRWPSGHILWTARMHTEWSRSWSLWFPLVKRSNLKEDCTTIYGQRIHRSRLTQILGNITDTPPQPSDRIFRRQTESLHEHVFLLQVHSCHCRDVGSEHTDWSLPAPCPATRQVAQRLCQRAEGSRRCDCKHMLGRRGAPRSHVMVEESEFSYEAALRWTRYLC